MIKIKKSTTAESRSCDYTKVTKDQLKESSLQHIDDVRRGMEFFAVLMRGAGIAHDIDKLQNIDGFYKDFSNGFQTKDWWERHKRISRHHLSQPEGIPDNVDLVDVFEYIVDCVMASKGRGSTFYPIEIDPDVLMTAFKNTAQYLQENVAVE